MRSGLVSRLAGSFRLRLIMWNALGVAVVGLATTIALRFLVSAALLADLDAVLKQDAQEILLDIPMKPLCRDDCPGICPGCGFATGSEQCTCDSGKQIDPRWLELRKIRDQIGS